MLWTQTTKNTFERRIGENETFIKLVGDSGLGVGREHWAVSVTAAFKAIGSWSASESKIGYCLREAWKRLRFEQPSIAAFVSGDKIMYEVPDPTELEAWADETFVVVSEQTITVGDVIANRKSSLFAMLYYIPRSGELVLQTLHWRTDGVGAFHVLDVYFDLVCQVAAEVARPVVWGEEVVRLAPSIEDAAGLPLEQAPELVAIAEKYVGTFALVSGQVGIRYQGDAGTPPAGTRSKLLQLSEADTSAVTSAAKSYGISVTSALHASVADANYAFTEDANRTKPFTSTIRFGLRPYLSEPYNTRTYGSALYTSGYMYQVPSTQNWSDNAAEFNREYRKGYASIMPAHRQYARLLSDAIRNMPPPTGPPDSNIDISSVGVLDKVIAPEHRSGDIGVEVTRVSLGVELLSRQMVCFVWTFRGCLNLQINYNEAYHTADEVEDILQHIRTKTVHELKIGR